MTGEAGLPPPRKRKEVFIDYAFFREAQKPHRTAGITTGRAVGFPNLVTAHQKAVELWYRGNARHEDARGRSGILFYLLASVACRI